MKLIKNVPEMPCKIVEPIVRKSIDQTIPSNPKLLIKPAIVFTDKVISIRRAIIKSVVTPAIMTDAEPQKKMSVPIPHQVNIKSYIPDNQDSLFWAMYIAKYGIDQYINIGKTGKKYGNIEIVRKRKIMEYLQEHKKSLKCLNHKLTNISIQEIIAAILANKKTTISCLAAFTVYYKKNIVVNNENNVTYIECTYNDDPPIILTYNKYKKYGYVDSANEVILQKIRNEKISMESHDKPIRGISLYTIDELRDIAYKIPTVTSISGWRLMKKPELYGKIWHALQWQ
jgi:hypothetical protein